MRAASHLGRVGGLAAALGVGVGVALSAGYGVAWADAHSADPPSPKVASESMQHSPPSHAGSHRVQATPNRPRNHTAAIGPAKTRQTVAAARPAPTQTTKPSSALSEAAQLPMTRAAARWTPPTHVSDVRIVNDALKPPAAPNTDPPAPADSAKWTLLAATRRELATEATSLAPAAAPSSAAAQLNPSSGRITVAPVERQFDDGIIHGTIAATDSRGLPLTYAVLNGPNQGGAVLLGAASGAFIYLPNVSIASSGGTKQFTVQVAETTPFDAALAKLPLVGSFVPQILLTVHRAPILQHALAPLIGDVAAVPVNVDVGALNPDNKPIAFTVMVTSFDGTTISTNFFPASGLAKNSTAPTVLWGSGFGVPGRINPYSQSDPANIDIAPLREHGYNVVTWDPRGVERSSGTLEFDSPDYEVRDVSAIIDYLTTQGETTTVSGDPLIGMVGGSYGGAIQLSTAAKDPRIDAIVPSITWHSLPSAFYENQAFKSSVALLLLQSLANRITLNQQIAIGTLTGVLTGMLTPNQLRQLAARGPGDLVQNIVAPTLLLQGTVDTMFPLSQADTSAQMLAANGVPVKMVWFCGGHAECLNPPSPIQNQIIQTSSLAWLDQYVKHQGTPADSIPVFQWIDQNGNAYQSDKLPFDPAFHGDLIVSSGGGGILPIMPIIGGSGPLTRSAFPRNVIEAAPARIAIDLHVSAPSTSDTTQIVGAPRLTLSYSGLGTSRFVYAQLVDDKTGLVLGNIVTPIPVTLDGRPHSITVPLEEVAYTMSPSDSLTLQIVGSATPYENFTSYGVINISSVQLSLPTVASTAKAVQEN